MTFAPGDRVVYRQSTKRTWGAVVLECRAGVVRQGHRAGQPVVRYYIELVDRDVSHRRRVVDERSLVADRDGT